MMKKLPGVQERPCYGTPGFRVKRKLLARMHQSEDAVVVKCDFQEREELTAANPSIYYITDHYTEHEWVLVRLSEVDEDELFALLEARWKQLAPQSLVEEYSA